MGQLKQMSGLGRDGHGRAPGVLEAGPSVSPGTARDMGGSLARGRARGWQACHRGRCGRCGAATRPRRRLQPHLLAPAGTPWPPACGRACRSRPSTVGMRIASVDGGRGVPGGSRVFTACGRTQGRTWSQVLEAWAGSQEVGQGSQPQPPQWGAHSSFCTCCGSPRRHSALRRPGARLSRWFGKRVVGPEGGAWGPVQGRNC